MGVKFDPKTGKWRASYSKRPKPGMSPVSKTLYGFDTEKQAEKAFRRIVTEINEKTKKRLSPLWTAVVEKYLENLFLRGISQKTIYSVRCALQAHTYPLWGNRCIDSIENVEIAELFHTRLKDSQPGNKQYVLKYIRQVFAFALEQGWVLKNPSPKMLFKKREKLKGVLTFEQVGHFLNKAKELDHPWYSHWVMALYTGMRNGELYALTWDKVDFENNLIKVDSSWNSRDGFKSTKSGDDRILEIAPPIRNLLREFKLKNDGMSFVLPRIAKWDKGEQARELRLFLGAIGLPPMRFHDLRATWATLLLSKGVEAIKVMKMGGWKDIETMQIYIRKAGIDIRGCMDNFVLHNPNSTPAKVISGNFGASL